jgi:type IV pilus assembly protein PilX
MKPIPMPLSGRRAQRGAVLLFALIALGVLLIGTVALMRSMNTSLFTAGNFGFKRDLTNQGERAVAAVLDLVQTGALGSDAAREANGEGIPLALLSDAAFAAVGAAGNDISAADMGVTVRYVIDRLCVATGPATPASCAVFSPPPQGGSSGAKDHDEPPTRFVYRVSIRVDGPRRTQSFFQSTFTI